MGAINQVFEEYGVGGFFGQNLYELLASWSSQGSEYVTTWKQYSSDVIMNSNRKPGAQSVHEQGVAEGEVIPFARKPQSNLTWQQLPKDVLKLANDWFWADDDDSSLAAVLDPKGYGSGTRNDVQYIAAQLQQRGWTIDHDLEDNRPDEFNLKLTNKRGQSVLLPWDDARNFTGWAQGTNSHLREQGVAEDAAGVGVVAKNKKMAKDPRYSMSMTQDVKPGQDVKNMRALRLTK
jgi:hypothetical protein